MDTTEDTNLNKKDNQSTTSLAVEKDKKQLNDKYLRNWQNRLLPTMTLVLLILTGFFLLTSLYQLYQIQDIVASSKQASFDDELRDLRAIQGELPGNNYEKVKWATLIKLESNALERRYHQASAILLARVWTIYLGFLTGMILALVGAIFILGKLQELPSEVDAGSEGFKAAVKSSSPGLILGVLGTILMAITILGQVNIKVEDRPLYVSDVGILATENGNDTDSKPSDKLTKDDLEELRLAKPKNAAPSNSNK